MEWHEGRDEKTSGGFAFFILHSIALDADGTEFVSARYMRIDKPGKVETISFGEAYVSSPGEYGHSLDKYAQKGQILPERIPDPWWEWDFGETRLLSYVEIQPDSREEPKYLSNR